MKSTFIPFFLLLFAISACKTHEKQEAINNNKRVEMEAILNKHLQSMESSVTVNYEQFREAMSNEDLVAYIDLNQFENCVRNIVTFSNKRLQIMRSSGCDAVLKNTSSADMMKQADFVRCDSLQSTLMTEYAKEVIQPFGAMLQDAQSKAAKGGK